MEHTLLIPASLLLPAEASLQPTHVFALLILLALDLEGMEGWVYFVHAWSSIANLYYVISKTPMCWGIALWWKMQCFQGNLFSLFRALRLHCNHVKYGVALTATVEIPVPSSQGPLRLQDWRGEPCLD